MSDFFRLLKTLVQKGDEVIELDGLSHFPSKAKQLLEELSLPELFNLDDLIQESFNPEFERNQNFKFMEFSDLPITVARGKNCFVDLYFWRRRPTTIHNHHFHGAFQSLVGLNLELEFSFKPERQLGLFHSLGKLELINESVLKPGQVIAINALDNFIHQNHHHNDLCINLCFRTPEMSDTNIANFLFSGFRYEKDQQLLTRSERLTRFFMMQKIDLNKLDLTSDDALCFLLQNHNHSSNNPLIKELAHHFDHLLQTTSDVNLPDLLHHHDQELEKIQDRYN